MESLLQQIIMSPIEDSNTTTWNSIQNQFLLDAWSFSTVQFTPINPPDLHFDPASTNSSLFCPLINEFQPFLDGNLSGSPDFGSFYESKMPGQEEYADNVDNYEVEFTENIISQGIEDGTSSYNVMNVDMMNNAAFYGETNGKAKKTQGMPSKNLMAERRRRKRLNDRLSMLRSIVPKISKMDRTSIVGDTIDYMRELLDKIHKLREAEGIDCENMNPFNLIGSYLKELKPNEMLVRNSPKFDIERRSEDTRVEIRCPPKPGLLLSTLSTMDALGLDVQQCVISCFNDFSIQASCYEVTEHQSLISHEDAKHALSRNAGYGGRCL